MPLSSIMSMGGWSKTGRQAPFPVRDPRILLASSSALHNRRWSGSESGQFEQTAMDVVGASA